MGGRSERLGLLHRVRMDEFVAHADSRGMRASELLFRCLTLDLVKDVPGVDPKRLA